MQAQPDAVPAADLDNAFSNLPRVARPGSATRRRRPPATVPELAERPPSRACMTLPVDAGQPGRPADRPDRTGRHPGRAATPRCPAACRPIWCTWPAARARWWWPPRRRMRRPSSGTVSIVTDTGRRYPMASRDLLARLGYGDVTPRQVPAQLVALLPQGPSLDAERARQPATDRPVSGHSDGRVAAVRRPPVAGLSRIPPGG